MIKIKIKSFGLVVLLGFIFSIGLADYDCGFFEDVVDDGEVNSESMRNKIIDNAKRPPTDKLEVLQEDDIGVSRWQTYVSCCEIGELDKGCKTANEYASSDNFPESPFVMDHIIDVGFRKLDGNEYDEYTYDSYEVKPDDQILEWEDTKEQIATSPEGYSLGDLHENFESMWRDGLYDKYIDLCNDVEIVYNNLPTREDFNRDSYEIDFVESCRQMVHNRNIQEINYMRILSSQVGGRYIKSSLDEYGVSFYERFDRLVTSLNQMYGWFAVVSNQVQEGTPVCN